MNRVEKATDTIALANCRSKRYTKEIFEFICKVRNRFCVVIYKFADFLKATDTIAFVNFKSKTHSMLLYLGYLLSSLEIYLISCIEVMLE